MNLLHPPYGCKAVGRMFCVMRKQEPSTFIIKRRDSPQCFWHMVGCATAPCKLLQVLHGLTIPYMALLTCKKKYEEGLGCASGVKNAI